ncbi:hypothetical protein PHLGIDRAFT_125256 [Phlebiopsis gigantea 11061_1 CR5-6]|uniref:Uncharacterized protein n=1 Tax=Phlebiopsis gigantea (strain 11061_1 CR5-6) TaxID=745531 RepID=A0A0C3S4Y4_PHLG1|nr:hypothetical protein PHLGIDRAFT_125256 [Phlebiopsis gigantea 11061_1 CR5-6]
MSLTLRFKWQVVVLLYACSQVDARTIIYNNSRCYNEFGDLIRCPINPLWYIIPIAVVCGLLVLFLVAYGVWKIRRNIKEYRELELAQRTNSPTQQV